MTRLDEIRARTEAATPGPWENSGTGGLHMDGTSAYQEINAVHPERKVERIARTQPPGHNRQDYLNGDFVAHARADVPYLLDRLQAVLDLHQPKPKPDDWNGFYKTFVPHCVACSKKSPCPTVKLIEETKP